MLAEEIKNEIGVSRHIKRLYILTGCLVVAFVVLALLVWRKSPHEILRQELRDLSFQMAQQPVPIHEQEESRRIREQTLESRMKEAHTILLCKHDVKWGKVRCQMTEVWKHDGSHTLPVSIGEPLAHHERKLERDVTPGQGMITFLNPSMSHPSSGLMIHNGKVVDAHVDPSRPPQDPYVRREFTVEEVKQMIETANKTPEQISEGRTRPTENAER
jgi:hypothetical protein